MKGMVFVGCSFTHGHGLWQYMDIKDNPKDDDCSELRSIHRLYQKTIRFPRLVANHFNTFEVVRDQFSGDDHNSIGYINQLLNIDSPIKFYGNYPELYFDLDDISYVIIQTSFIERSPYILDESDLNKLDNLNEVDDNNKFSKIQQWGYETFNDYLNGHLSKWYRQYKKLIKYLENRGIRVLLINITDDFHDIFLKDDFLKNKLVYLDYNNKKYTNINSMLNDNKSLIIKYDYDSFGLNPPKDLHPSKKGHEIISKSIIKKIENEI